MAEIVRYVNPGSVGGDGTTANLTGATAAYASLSSAEANEQADFVTNTDNLVINCAGTTADTTAVDFDGSTTSALYDIEITGDWTGAVYSTSYYRIELTATASNQSALFIQDLYITINNLQVQLTNSGGYTTPKGIRTNTSNITINDTVIKAVLSGAGSTGRGLEVWTGSSSVVANNVLILDWVNGTETCFGVLSVVANALDMSYSDVINCRTGLECGVANGILSKNVITQSCNNGFNGTFATGSDYNLSDITSDAPGGNSVTATLTFADAANDDYHLASGDTSAIGAGTPISGRTLDIDGDTRDASTPDIGFDEYVAVGGATIPILAYHYNHNIGSHL